MTVPALRQSHVAMMACPESYRVQVIEGKRMPASPFSDRGTEIHRIMAAYIDHCTAREVPSDWVEFDRLAAAAGPEAGPILDGLRENYQVQWQTVIATEQKLALDAWMRPIDSPFPAPNAVLSQGDGEAYHEGTLDVIEISDDLKSVTIPDFKSHFRPFEPETYQSKNYPAFIFQHMPKVESVTFELIFVRFKNARRSVTYTRNDLPVLLTEMDRRKQQQFQIHGQVDRGEQVQALPGDHCVYCPHNAANTCPVAEFNPYVNKTMEERLRFLAWLEKSWDENAGVLKAYVDAAGPVSYADGNGQRYEFGNHTSENASFPAIETMAMLMEWHEAGADPALFSGLTISGLTSKLKTNKRAQLHQRLLDSVAKTKTRVQFGIHKPDGSAKVVEKEEW